MVDFRAARSIGERIQAARKWRGIRSTRELAFKIGDGKTTESVLENIESGRKVTLDISTVLNVAMALDVPLSFLLAPIGHPDAPLDLPNLSPAFNGMTAAQFDAWLSAVEGGAHIPSSIQARNATAELHALRALAEQRTEIRRLEAVLELEKAHGLEDDVGYARSTPSRLQDAKKEELRLREYLSSAGWAMG